jgi:predicted DNA-binding protein
MTTARERVLLAYGNCCSWCGSQQNLEIDHVFEDGADHRRALGSMKIERWILNEYARTGFYPPTITLLCKTHHDAKSGRRPKVPARQGNTSINVSLPDELVERLDLLASKPGLTRSKVVTDAIRSLVEGSASQTLLEDLHRRQDRLEATLEPLAQALKALTLAVGELERSVTAQGKRWQQLEGELNAASDRSTGYIPYTPQGTNGQRPHGLARFFRR